METSLEVSSPPALASACPRVSKAGDPREQITGRCVLIKGRKGFSSRPLRGFGPLRGLGIGRGILLILAVWCVFGAPVAAPAEQGGPPKSGSGKEKLFVNPRYQDDGSTPLHDAARSGNVAEASALISAGLDVNAKTKRGQTPLHFVVFDGNMQLVRVFIGKGADINAKDVNGRTPLHMTAIEDRSNIQVAIFLLTKGANVNAKDNFGYAPLHYAAITNYPDNGELAGYFIEKGADVNARSNRGSIPLHEAALEGKVAAVRVLIESGADMEAKTNNGNTPLHEAAQWGRPESVVVLLERGADVKAKNMAGETPLDVANRRVADFSQTHMVRAGARAVIDVIEGWLEKLEKDGSSSPFPGLDPAGKQVTDGIKAPEEEFLQP